MNHAFKCRGDALRVQIESIKAVIDVDIKKHYSLPELVRMAALNEYTLKQLFKHYYGTSVINTL